ncbi:MAG: HD domain-containing protein [Candidatus Nomurabacteria bacterium]|nr:MAG: HD domain-containing protein [Candidatus Nomurabacteria bacterium]
MSLERDIQFLYEVGTFRFIPRTWRQFLNADFANDSEHTIRVIWIALTLARHENQGDAGKIAKMALVHDLPETRTGDVHYVSRLYTSRNEEKAAQDIFHDTSLGSEYVELFREYQAKESIEAKIVKDADILDQEFEISEQSSKGNKINETFGPKRQSMLREKLSTASAKKIWDAIQKANPHDWHDKGVNRFSEGDWKKEA